MNRATSALLALLLVCSLVAVPGLAAGSGIDAERDEASTAGPPLEQPALSSVAPIEADNTTNRLPLTGEVNSEHTEHGTDLGARLASTDDELRIDHEQYVLVDSEFNMATTDEREAMIERAYDRLRDRADALETRERAVVRAHANDEQSAAALIQTVVRNANEAAVLSEAFDDLSERADLVPGYSLSIQDDQDELAMHRTTAKTQLEAVQNVRGEDRVVSVQTSADGYTLSLIDGDYVLETTRFDNRDTDQPTQFDDITDAYESVEAMYPWVFETRGSAKVSGLTRAQLYLVEASHEHGQLDVYLDGGTGDVYREIQELNHNALPIVDEQTWSDDGLELSLNRTPANGPAKVTVTNAATGEPETATVTIDGVEVGETDEDGSLWIVPPAGQYELEATAATGTVDATVAND